MSSDCKVLMVTTGNLSAGKLKSIPTTVLLIEDGSQVQSFYSSSLLSVLYFFTSFCPFSLYVCLAKY